MTIATPTSLATGSVKAGNIATSSAFTPTVGRLMVVMAVGMGGTVAASFSISDSWSLTWNAVPDASSTSTTAAVQVWWVIVPAGSYSSGTVTVNSGGGKTYVAFDVVEVASGFNTTNPIAGAANAIHNGLVGSLSDTLPFEPASTNTVLTVGAIYATTASVTVSWSSPLSVLITLNLNGTSSPSEYLSVAYDSNYSGTTTTTLTPTNNSTYTAMATIEIVDANAPLAVTNPVAFGQGGPGISSIASAAFVPKAGHLMVALGSAFDTGGGSTTLPTITDSWGLTWHAISGATGSEPSGYAESGGWWTIVPAGTYASGNVTVTFANSDAVAMVQVFDFAYGFNASNPIGLSAYNGFFGTASGITATFSGTPKSTSAVVASCAIYATSAASWSSPIVSAQNTANTYGSAMSGYENGWTGSNTVSTAATTSDATINAVEVLQSVPSNFAPSRRQLQAVNRAANF